MASSRFFPGKSGNPGGRPKSTAPEARRVAENIDAIGLLGQIAYNEKNRPSDRITAIKELLDRGWGKSVDIQAQFLLDGREGGEHAALVRGAMETLARALGGQAPAPLPSETTIDVEPKPVDAAPLATQSAVVADQQDPKPE